MKTNVKPGTSYDLDTKQGMANAVQWLSNHIDSLTDNGMWIVPRSASIVTINKKTKTATITCFAPDPSLARVFRAMGWSVVEK